MTPYARHAHYREPNAITDARDLAAAAQRHTTDAWRRALRNDPETIPHTPPCGF